MTKVAVIVAMVIGLSGCATMKDVFGEPGRKAYKQTVSSQQTWSDVQERQSNISPTYSKQEAEWDKKFLKKRTIIEVEVIE